MNNRRIKTLVIALLLLAMAASMTGCYRLQMVPYYRDKSNYQSYTGTLEELYYHEKDGSTALYLIIDDQQPALADRTFALEGENLTVALANGIEDLEIGSEVSFVTAPKYYGDGYVLPLVGLSANGTVYLDAETGIDHWITLLAERS